MARLGSCKIVALALFCLGATATSPAAQDSRAAGAELGRIALGRGGLMPQVERQVLPAYPADGAGAWGAVEIEAVVGTSGSVIHARQAKSGSGSGALARAALEAARAWRFRPAVDASGQPTPALVLLRVEFAPSNSRGNGPRVTALVQELPGIPLPEADAAIARDPADARTPDLQVPRAVRMVQPNYSTNALRAGIQGTVVMDVLVLPDGTVGATRVTRSLDNELDQEAQIAARYWLFEPARLNRRPVAFRAVLELSFRLRRPAD